MKRVQSIDDYFVNIIQVIYLWLWDWTGVYVGTLIFLASVASFMTSPSSDIMNWCVLGGGIFIAGHRYLLQGQSHRLFNDQQRMFRDFPFRQGASLATIILVICEFVTLNVPHTMAAIIGVFWLYIGCVQIRDREPKDCSRKSLAGAK